ncbi:palmitoyl-CoA hydrolase [Sediminicola sp. YIK13]|uniref:acyl-CoA thioesterase n=1 Tax=Sediminicola sp. YIK13 TaxID=1453352 RepID=UPI00072047F0|nr:acyl-CoA thioesterase II [Sediminicola sp. YIK13]ALM07076.1 palmitoyl-CoA hydrolase [Sediminicola sp. YIK13]
MNSAKELLNILELIEVGTHQFEGESKTIGSPNVFGGQVLAQALNAAYRTITNNRILHSLHSYFLEAGNLELAITYEVSIIRDGGSFSTRRVTALQRDKIIFILSASFHKIEEGYEHQIPMKTNVKPPEELLSWEDLLEQYGKLLPKNRREFLEIKRPIDFKPTVIANPMDRKDLPPFNDIWFKLKGNINGLELPIKQQILTYISDYNILLTAILPNASKAHYGNLQMASLDHSMWFFREFDFDDWMLFSIDSPSSGNARGFSRGNIFSRDGKLIASVAQEGLLRPWKKQ